MLCAALSLCLTVFFSLFFVCLFICLCLPVSVSLFLSTSPSLSLYFLPSLPNLHFPSLISLPLPILPALPPYFFRSPRLSVQILWPQSTSSWMPSFLLLLCRRLHASRGPYFSYFHSSQSVLFESSPHPPVFPMDLISSL